MTAVLWLALLLNPSLTSNDPTPPTPPARPSVEVDQAHFDWGSAYRGEAIRHEFELRNTGSEAIRVVRVRTACGCTTVDYPETIPANGSSTLTIELNTSNLSARKVVKSVLLFTSVSSTPTKLSLGGLIHSVVNVEPRAVVLAGLASREKSLTLTVSPGYGDTLRVIEAIPMSNHVEVRGISPTEHGTHEIELVASPSEKSVIRRDVVRVIAICADGERREQRIPVLVEHRDRIHSSTRAVVFPKAVTAAIGNEPPVRTISIRAEDPDVSFSIEHVRIEGAPVGLFRARVQSVVPGRQFEITVECLHEHDRPLARGKVVITTTDTAVPRIEIPLIAQFRSTASAHGKKAGPTSGAAQMDVTGAARLTAPRDRLPRAN